MDGYKLFYQRHLPHYQPSRAALFITFRLAGSLPQTVIQNIAAEMQRKQVEIDRFPTSEMRAAALSDAQKQLFSRFELDLDAARHGPRWLSEPAVAQIVSNALHYRDGKIYQLDAFCIMPNHVHMVCTPLQIDGSDISLAKLMHSLKGYTARQANQYLRRNGDFWQHESYDHIIRDPSEHARIVAYVLQNPVKAGLSTNWVYCRANC